jgi:hypothetical protein
MADVPGTLDQFRLWGRSLGTPEIQALYLAENASTTVCSDTP